MTTFRPCATTLRSATAAPQRLPVPVTSSSAMRTGTRRRAAPRRRGRAGRPSRRSARPARGRSARPPGLVSWPSYRHKTRPGAGPTIRNPDPGPRNPRRHDHDRFTVANYRRTVTIIEKHPAADRMTDSGLAGIRGSPGRPRQHRTNSHSATTDHRHHNIASWTTAPMALTAFTDLCIGTLRRSANSDYSQAHSGRGPWVTQRLGALTPAASVRHTGPSRSRAPLTSASRRPVASRVCNEFAGIDREPLTPREAAQTLQHIFETFH